MFDGINRRVVSVWFPRLATDRVLRGCPVDGPFALTLNSQNADRIYCLNQSAVAKGLSRGMPLADARAFCPDVITRPADPTQDTRFLGMLRRWATRYCPWAGLEDADGLVMDITGSAHLTGGEAALLEDMKARLERAGLHTQLGLADTRGGAWALAHYRPTIAAPGQTLPALADLPVAALRLSASEDTALQRLGLRSVGDLAGAARAPLARRFGPSVLMRLDQALGALPEQISPQADPPHFATQMTLPEPIGLTADVMAGVERILAPLCSKLQSEGRGARVLCLSLRRVDQASQQVELRLAAPMRDPKRILPLFERGVGEVDAGFGIDQLRIEAVQHEHLPAQQLTHSPGAHKDGLEDLITRIGARIGLENVQRFLPADSHIPERSFLVAPAAYTRPESGFSAPRPRPLCLFPPEPIAGHGAEPPQRFRWRRMSFQTARITGPERLSPEWWLDDPNWRSGVRDYWRVDTKEGRRLWLFHTPQAPGWFVEGEFA